MSETQDPTPTPTADLTKAVAAAVEDFPTGGYEGILESHREQSKSLQAWVNAPAKLGQTAAKRGLAILTELEGEIRMGDPASSVVDAYLAAIRNCLYGAAYRRERQLLATDTATDLLRPGLYQYLEEVFTSLPGGPRYHLVKKLYASDDDARLLSEAQMRRVFGDRVFDNDND